MTSTATADPPWIVFARLPSGETLVPGATKGCPGPDVWGRCPAVDAGRQPGCQGATWLYGPEPTFKAHVPSTSGICPLVLLNPRQPLTEAEY